VQGEIEKAIAVFTKEHVRVCGAGRTDAGVHAAGQVASFTLESAVDPYRLFRALNGILPRDLRAISADLCDPGFDPRRSSTGKTYVYRILNRPAAPVLLENRVFHFPFRLDAKLMKEVAQSFEGKHNFSAFRSSDCEAVLTKRDLHRCSVTGEAGSLICIEVTARSFLKNMIRIMAGTLLEIGNGRFPPDRIATVLETGDRNQAGPTAPGHGLTLEKVYFGPGFTDGIDWPVYIPVRPSEGRPEGEGFGHLEKP
jgi:tRNA pseudouridine38-40 synthase